MGGRRPGPKESLCRAAASLAWLGRMPPYCWMPWTRPCVPHPASPPPEECAPLPTPCLQTLPHKAFGALVPHEFRTKESEAHGLDSPGEKVWKGNSQSGHWEAAGRRYLALRTSAPRGTRSPRALKSGPCLDWGRESLWTHVPPGHPLHVSQFPFWWPRCSDPECTPFTSSTAHL